MTLHAPEYIRSLKPYVPGKPIEETQREYRLKKVIKLASNENPLGASPKAKLALRKALKDLHRYPDGSGFHLKNKIAAKESIHPSEIILGNGSNEVIEMLIRAYCSVGDAIVTSDTAFIAYTISAQIQGVRTLAAQSTPDLKYDLNAMLELLKKDEKAKLVFIANPNNPTGTYVSEQALRAFLKELKTIRDGSVIAVLDSAYNEYVTATDLPDAVKLWKDFPDSVVVLKTFSKVYGLAGLRIGYGMASREVIGTLDKVRMPFNLNSVALVAAEAALSDKSFVNQAVKLNQAGMKFWSKGLAALGVPFWPSQGNFILADSEIGFGMSGPELYQKCLMRGVILRPVANYGLPNAIRISIGTPEENKMALQVLKEWARGTKKKSQGLQA